MHTSLARRSFVAAGLLAIAAGFAPTVFAAPAALTLTHRFSDDEGGYPSDLARGVDGDYYGVTEVGGSKGGGAFFKMTPAGSVTKIHDFSETEGYNPNSPLALGSDGNFYGTTFLGGSARDGVIFRVTPAGVVSTLHPFDGSTASSPVQGLFLGADGNFYGTTAGSIVGTIFRVTPAGQFTTLHTFDYPDPTLPTIVASGTDGAVYGFITRNDYTGSSIFRMTLDGTVTTLYAGPAGRFIAHLILSADGNLYGVSQGANCVGDVFKLTTAGAFTTLHEFTNGAGGPTALAQTADGKLYGVTGCVINAAGNTQRGFVFEMTPSGAYTALTTLTDDDGGMGIRGLALTLDGALLARDGDAFYRFIFGASLTINHKASFLDGGQSVCATATKNGEAAPVAGFLLSFKRTGPNASSSQVATDAQGQATVCWDTSYVWDQVADVDRTAVSDGSTSDTSVVTWIRTMAELQADPLVTVAGGSTVQFNPSAVLDYSYTDRGHVYHVPLVGKSVSFYTGSEFLCAGVTDANGRAKCAARPRAHIDALRNKGYTAIFGGDAQWLPVHAQATF
jgi:uncharacterized repeat protein (TIGR03803 family)